MAKAVRADAYTRLRTLKECEKTAALTLRNRGDLDFYGSSLETQLFGSLQTEFYGDIARTRTLFCRLWYCRANEATFHGYYGVRTFERAA